MWIGKWKIELNIESEGSIEETGWGYWTERKIFWKWIDIKIIAKRFKTDIESEKYWCVLRAE